MNLRSIANNLTRTVNPNIQISYFESDGYTTGAGQRQVPAYKTAVPGYGNLQALDGDDLKQLDGLNIQGKIKALFMYGEAAGVVRPDQKGGDKLTIDGQTWLVVRVLEGWGNWCKLAIVLQSDA
jgi:hypothetical protein